MLWVVHLFRQIKSDRWNKISNTKNFWANLEWMPGAKRLYSFIMKYDAHILSAYSKEMETLETER